MLYFAYGSNMSTARLRYRVKSAAPLGFAQLEGVALRWHKKSKDGSGKCNAFPADGKTLIGVAFEFDAKEKRSLDDAEGLGFGYNEQKIDVRLAGRPTTVFVYFADTRYIDDSLVPYTWYKDFVVSGAKEHRVSSNTSLLWKRKWPGGIQIRHEKSVRERR